MTSSARTTDLVAAPCENLNRPVRASARRLPGDDQISFAEGISAKMLLPIQVGILPVSALGPDHHRTATPSRVVALLDGGEERVEMDMHN